MQTSLNRPLPPMEVKRIDSAAESRSKTVNKIDHEEIDAVLLAKTGMGAVIKDAIGGEPLKSYGDPGFVSKVVSGEKVPDYLAAIYANEGARLRMAKALLRSSGKQVKERTVFEIEERTA
jgi:hypothetical protein